MRVPRLQERHTGVVTQGMPPHSSGFCLHPSGGTARGATWVSRPGTVSRAGLENPLWLFLLHPSSVLSAVGCPS